MVDSSYKQTLKRVRAPLHHFHMLGVHYESTAAELTAARRVLAQEFHPDLNGDPSAAGVMTDINVAYDTLSNKQLRFLYMLTLSQTACAACGGAGCKKKQVGGFRGGVRRYVCMQCNGSGRS